MIDFGEKVCSVVFTSGCNFGCSYCHNPELVQFKSRFDESEVLEFLKNRVGQIDGVVITGGEPTLQRDLEGFISHIKQLGLTVKLDSNGSNPGVLRDLINKKLLDYIAMDIKAPFSSYHDIINTFVPVENFRESISIIRTSGTDYEFRTTVVKAQLTKTDILDIARSLKGSRRYILQKFIPSRTLSPSFMSESTYSDEEFRSLVAKIREEDLVDECYFR